MVEAQSIAAFFFLPPSAIRRVYPSLIFQCASLLLSPFILIYLFSFALSGPNKGTAFIYGNHELWRNFECFHNLLYGLQELIRPPYWSMHSNCLKHALQIITDTVGALAHGKIRANIFHYFAWAYKTSRYVSRREKRVKVKKCTYLIRIKFPIPSFFLKHFTIFNIPAYAWHVSSLTLRYIAYEIPTFKICCRNSLWLFSLVVGARASSIIRIYLASQKTTNQPTYLRIPYIESLNL